MVSFKQTQQRSLPVRSKPLSAMFQAGRQSWPTIQHHSLAIAMDSPWAPGLGMVHQLIYRQSWFELRELVPPEVFEARSVSSASGLRILAGKQTYETG